MAHLPWLQGRELQETVSGAKSNSWHSPCCWLPFLLWLLRVALKRAKGLPAERRMPDRSAIDFRVHVGSEVPQVRSGYYTAGRSNQRHSFAELVQHWLLE